MNKCQTRFITNNDPKKEGLLKGSVPQAPGSAVQLQEVLAKLCSNFLP